MSPLRWLLVVVVVGAFVFAKAWIFTHPKSSIGLLIGAFLLILTEPAKAGEGSAR